MYVYRDSDEKRAGRGGKDGRRHGEERGVSEFLQNRERVKRESDGS